MYNGPKSLPKEEEKAAAPDIGLSLAFLLSALSGDRDSEPSDPSRLQALIDNLSQVSRSMQQGHLIINEDLDLRGLAETFPPPGPLRFTLRNGPAAITPVIAQIERQQNYESNKRDNPPPALK